MTKISEMRAQTTASKKTRLMAVIISLLESLPTYEIERVLKTVCFHFGLKAERL